MSCKEPLLAIKHFVDKEGKTSIHFIGKREGIDYRLLCDRYGKENILLLPCGKCSGCIEARTRSWSVRCVLEASLYDQNSFITLTYRPGCVPKYGLSKEDLQKFIKRLRKEYPDQTIRYFACGEYGSKTLRPHYHLIIFGWFPEDATWVAQGRYGGSIYRSKKLEKLWPYGLCEIGEVSYSSCGYVARYCMKKLKHPALYNEFQLMSLKPGIGEGYFNAHKEDIYSCDKIYFNFGSSVSASPCRYFDKLFSLIKPEELEKVKNERISRANLKVANELFVHAFDHLEELNKYKGEIKDLQLRSLKRKGDF